MNKKIKICGTLTKEEAKNLAKDFRKEKLTFYDDGGALERARKEDKLKEYEKVKKEMLGSITEDLVGKFSAEIFDEAKDVENNWQSEEHKNFFKKLREERKEMREKLYGWDNSFNGFLKNKKDNETINIFLPSDEGSGKSTFVLEHAKKVHDHLKDYMKGCESSKIEDLEEKNNELNKLLKQQEEQDWNNSIIERLSIKNKRELSKIKRSPFVNQISFERELICFLRKNRYKWNKNKDFEEAMQNRKD